MWSKNRWNFLPIGPVVFLDTAGLDDETELGRERIKKTEKVFDRADVVVILISGENWGKTEDEIVAKAKNYNTPVVVIINKIDISPVSAEFMSENLKLMRLSFRFPVLTTKTAITTLMRLNRQLSKIVLKISSNRRLWLAICCRPAALQC